VEFRGAGARRSICEEEAREWRVKEEGELPGCVASSSILKMAVLRQQRYRYCRYEDERVSSLLGWQVSPDVRLNFNSSQAPIHISRHRLESRLTMDCSGARIQECESCLTEGYGDSEEGRRGGEDSEAPRHERIFKRL
jgi:hypothetical protein